MESIISPFGSLENADQVLAQFGTRQRYVLLITTLLSFNWALAAIPVMHGIFIIDDDCFLNGTTSNINIKNLKLCVENSRKITPVSEFNLHGNRRYLLEWTTSGFMLGNMIGASTLTYLSDKFGRRPVLILSLLVLGIIGLLTSFAESILAFIIGRFIQGFCSPGPLLVGWVLSYESVPIGLRGLVTLMYGIMWVVGYCTVAPLNYFIINWRWLMVAYSVPSVIIAGVYFLIIPESLHFLIVNGRKQKAAKWIRNAVKYGKVLHERSIDMMVELLENTNSNMKMDGNKKEIIEENMRTSDTFVYYGLSTYSIHLPGNKYWNYVLSGLAELPAYIIIPYALENFGRKRIVAYTHCLVGTTHIVLIFIPNNYVWLSVTCWLVSKFAISSSFMCIFVYGSEIFPTTIRNACLGLCAVIARFGGVIAPYVVLLSSVHALLPTILFGSVALIAGTLTCILPETKECTLPSSLDESVYIKKYHSSKSSRSQRRSNIPTTSSDNQIDS
ncbi:unnamed protein product [Onchocerca ochengi]|uniref:MFS domain-containing protein n=1 Tax=Onchocerca ochengi TaxID=42157 RepID=A0A182E414_ONCOC|nr:unnamed protein product [Onchocerca ochengi]